MIRPEELRIGNFVSIDGDISSIQQICKESEKGKNQRLGIRWYTDSYSGWIDCTEGGIEPIPLTEQWLIDFGFERVCTVNVDYWYLDEDLFRFTFDIKGRLHCSVGDNDFGVVYKLIYSVHELQNLYYALTGEELKKT